MTGGVERWLCRVLRVPPQPDPPPGESVRIFRAGRNFFRYNVFKWAIGQFFVLIGILGGAFVSTFVFTEEPIHTIILAAEIFAAATFLFQLPFTFAIRRLDYDMRWYIVTDRSLRIREGIVNVQEKTITFANIQNLALRQGPLQRLLGLADVEVKTAGGGGSEQKKQQESPFAKDLHTAHFHGVDNAEEIRDTVLARLRLHRSTGLGDPDEEEHREHSVQEAAAELREEARRLVSFLSSS
jgi:uncharacterized membrane protein YdbT with pleckstrin-like domain